MVENTSLSNEQQKRALAQKLWLAYFNSYLYENGMITEPQRNHMINKIDSREPSTVPKINLLIMIIQWSSKVAKRE